MLAHRIQTTPHKEATALQTVVDYQANNISDAIARINSSGYTGYINSNNFMQMGLINDKSFIIVLLLTKTLGTKDTTGFIAKC